MSKSYISALLLSFVAPCFLFCSTTAARAQSLNSSNIAGSSPNGTLDSSTSGSSPAGAEELPEAPDPADRIADPEPVAVGEERPHMPWAAVEHQQPFSRIGIGGDISPLGVGVKSAVILTEKLDARLMGNFFRFETGRFELEGFNVDAKLHLASAAASVDWYPLKSVWRVSVGTLFLNRNQISASTQIVPGTKFSLDSQTFYAASANTVPGATPLTGSGVLGLDTRRPALTLSGGFGEFIPRSNRHWSFPSEFGVAFIGAPIINVNTAGWVCLDKAQTECGSINDPTNPAAIAFNSALQATLTKWRKDLSGFTIYPLFSYSVVYSFNIR